MEPQSHLFTNPGGLEMEFCPAEGRKPNLAELLVIVGGWLQDMLANGEITHLPDRIVIEFDAKAMRFHPTPWPKEIQ